MKYDKKKLDVSKDLTKEEKEYFSSLLLNQCFTVNITLTIKGSVSEYIAPFFTYPQNNNYQLN